MVAIGTLLPELVVSLIAAREAQPSLAMANLVGSNIVNVAATLGLTTLLLPLPVHGNAVHLEWPVMFGASVLLLGVAHDGVVGRADAAAFPIALVLFVVYTVHVARRAVTAPEASALVTTDVLCQHRLDTRGTLAHAAGPPGSIGSQGRE